MQAAMRARREGQARHKAFYFRIYNYIPVDSLHDDQNGGGAVGIND
jgi:hypothetical protein